MSNDSKELPALCTCQSGDVHEPGCPRAAPQSGMRTEGEALQLVCSSRPRPSVHRTGKGHQHWRRDVHHVLAPPSIAGRDKVTLCKLDASEWLVIGDAPANLADNPDLCAHCKLALPAASPAAPSSPRSAGPTGVEAAKIVAEYIRLRSTLDEDDAANIIHILHEAGVRFRLPSSDVAEGAGETDALARENHWRKLEGRDPASLKPAPDVMQALREKIGGYINAIRLGATNEGVTNAIMRDLDRLSAPVPPPDGAAKPWSDDVRSALADEIDAALTIYLNNMGSVGNGWRRHEVENLLWDNKVGIIAALRSAPVSGPTRLPCDVHLPPNTYIRKGRMIETLMVAIQQREKYTDEECTLTPSNFAPPSAPVVGVTREAIAQFVEKVAASYHGEAVVYSRTNVGNILATTATSIRLLPVPDATVSEPPHWREVEIVRLIDLLRSEEGDSVDIFCDNPDFGMGANNAISCNGWWTGFKDRRFEGVSLLDALSAAMIEYKRPRSSDGGNVSRVASPESSEGAGSHSERETARGMVRTHDPIAGIASGPSETCPQHVGREATVSARDAVIEECRNKIGDLRISEAGLFDVKHSGQRGQDRSDALYDACELLRSLTRGAKP